MEEKITLKSLLKQKDTEAELYVIGLFVILILAVVTAGLLLLQRYTSVHMLEFCLFRKLLGIYCPGCGGTRSIYYLLHGNLLKSLYYNPFATFLALGFLLFYISQTLRFLTHGKIKGFRFRSIYAVIAVVLLVANFLIKNILLIAFHIQLIP